MQFKLKNPSKRTGKATVFIRYAYAGKDILKSTGVTLLPQHFNTSNGKVSKSDEEASVKQPQITRVKQLLESVVKVLVSQGVAPTAKAVSEYYDLSERENQEVATELEEFDAAGKTEVELVEAEIAELEKLLVERKEYLNSLKHIFTPHHHQLFTDCITKYQEINPKRRKPGTLLGLNTLILLVKEFNASLGLEEINLEILNSFQDFLIEKKKLRNRTIRLAITRFKTVLKYSTKGRNINLDFLADFELVRDLGNDNIIYLTQEELTVIATIEPTTLTPRQRQVQQQFLFAAEMGLRHSDIFVTAANVEHGHLVVTMKKTDKVVRIPLSEKAKAIMASTDFPFKPIQTSDYDKAIKAICKRFECFQQPITLTHFVGNVPTPEIKPKWQVMSSHVARKTAINYWLSKGVAESVVVQWAGHKNNKMLHEHYQHKQAASDREALKLLIH